jgi:hypothetical protein
MQKLNELSYVKKSTYILQNLINSFFCNKFIHLKIYIYTYRIYSKTNFGGLFTSFDPIIEIIHKICFRYIQYASHPSNPLGSAVG